MADQCRRIEAIYDFSTMPSVPGTCPRHRFGQPGDSRGSCHIWILYCVSLLRYDIRSGLEMLPFAQFLSR